MGEARWQKRIPDYLDDFKGLDCRLCLEALSSGHRDVLFLVRISPATSIWAQS